MIMFVRYIGIAVYSMCSLIIQDDLAPCFGSLLESQYLKLLSLYTSRKNTLSTATAENLCKGVELGLNQLTSKTGHLPQSHFV